MADQTENAGSQADAFQKIWFESMSKLMQAAFTFSPNSTPPELLRQIRNSIFEALGQSWNEFLRSPQFQQQMKQWMDNAVAFREMSGDFMAKVRKEMQAPSRDDIDAVQQNVRHLETRILDRLEVLSKQIEELKHRTNGKPAKSPAAPKKSSKAKPSRKKPRPVRIADGS